MAINGLQIIGESINDSVPSTHELFEKEDLDGIRQLVRFQEERGAAYIDVNVGLRTPELMAQLIKEIQHTTVLPLSIDSPDPALAGTGLNTYREDLAAHRLPILNSISALRPEMFPLYAMQKFRPILLVTERDESGKAVMNSTSAEIYDTARVMLQLAVDAGVPVEDCIIDVGIAPLAIDTENRTRRTVDSIRLISSDPAFRGCSFVLGISNFTHMLPSRRPSDNLPLRSALESALLTKLLPLGFNMVVGSVKRNYQLLPPDHPAMVCLEQVLQLDGFDTIMQVQNFLIA